MTDVTLDNFEAALLVELRSHVADQMEPRPRGSNRRWTVGVVAAAAAAAAILAGGLSLRPTPSFAVERQPDGDIVVTVHRLADPEGLERALADKGISADVTYDDKAQRPSDLDHGGRVPACATSAPGDVVIDPADDGGFTFTLDADYVAAHNTVLHLTTAGGPTADDWMAVSVRWEGSAC